MSKNSEINKLIIETIENASDDKIVKELIKELLQYELDTWNRNILPSSVKDTYDQIVDNIIKRGKK